MKRCLLGLLLVVVGLASPVFYVETMCRGEGPPAPYAALVAEDHHRPESRTLMTYPEWDIVHAYEDYARVVQQGDPHDYQFLKAIGSFWGSLCSLSKVAPEHGTVDGGTKQMVYVIGVSFTAELLLKAAYEETLGRAFAALRGETRAPLDDLSAQQAQAYATFLQQVPWYKWPFEDDAAALNQSATDLLRDTERRLALGLEYRAKAAYADVIAQAVAQVGPDQLRLRMIVSGGSASDLDAIDGIAVIATRPEGIEIETPRYRELTHLLVHLAEQGWDFVEIAGNDDILFTALSEKSEIPEAFYSRPRQGIGDNRHLIRVKVVDLAQHLRRLQNKGLTLEHIHDY
jgi:hypothetical protein